VGWILPAKGTVQWRDFVNTAMNFRVRFLNQFSKYQFFSRKNLYPETTYEGNQIGETNVIM